MFRFTVSRHLSSLFSLLYLSLMSPPDRRCRIAIYTYIYIYLVCMDVYYPIPKNREIHSAFVSRFVLGQVDVVVQHIEVNEILFL